MKYKELKEFIWTDLKRLNDVKSGGGIVKISNI